MTHFIHKIIADKKENSLSIDYYFFFKLILNKNLVGAFLHVHSNE